MILGAAPDERGDPAQREAFTKILREADQFRLPKMQLADFLRRIGWKNMSPVVRYGQGANSNDFRAKPDAGVVRKSTGNTSDVFKEREAPAQYGSLLQVLGVEGIDTRVDCFDTVAIGGRHRPAHNL